MADGTKAGGDAPRTLFSLGRSGKRKGRAAQASPLEDYPPRHADDSADTGVATLEADAELEADQDGSELADATTDAPDTDAPADDAPEEIDASEDAASEPCPSCSLPLVAGAMFCGECGTRVTDPDAAAPAAVLLDDEVPGEPLPPEAEGSFEVAEPVTGTLEDDDDLVEDDGAIGESAVFGAFIGAEDETDAEPEAEAELAEEDPEAELVEEDPEAELVEEDPEAQAELVEEDPEAEAELVEEDPEAEAELVEEDPEAELVEADPDAEVTDDDGAVVPIAAAATAGAAVAGLAATDSADAATLESSTAGGSGGSGGGSKKGVWIGAAAAAAAVVLIIGVVALGSGGKSAAKKDDQVAAGTQKSTTTTAAPSTTASSTVTTQAPTTVTETPTTDTSVPDSSTSSTAGATTSTVQHDVGPPPPPPPASPANVQVSCPPNLKPDSTTAITLHNVGGTSTSFLVTWSALKTGVTVSPTTGTVGASSTATILVHVAPGTPGSGSRVTIKWSGGATSCNLLVQ